MLRGMFAGWLLATGFAFAQTPERAVVEKIMEELSAATGFPVRRPVSFQVLSRKQVNQFLEQRIQEAIKPEEIRAEELTLKKFGFVPPDFDLRKTTVDLLTEQTAAFYDYHRKRLYLADWTSFRMRQAATVHELAHALADQSYGLERFAKRVEHDSEQSAARQAVVEGQANWLMQDLLRRRPAPEATTEPDTDSGVFDRAPLYLRETLTFPYNQGERFQQAVYARFGEAAFRMVFEDPPVSTQQILHPGMYFANVRPEQVTVPKLPGMRRSVEGTLGELEHSILLRQFTTAADAADVSPHLRGARYEIWQDRKKDGTALVYRSAWESDSWAARFFELYKQVIQGKWKRVEITVNTGRRFSGKSEDGYFSVELTGAAVLSREGLAKPPTYVRGAGAVPEPSATGK